jgi:hypothetical protein
MTLHPLPRYLLAATAALALSWPTLALDRQSVIKAGDAEHVLVIRATVASPAGPVFALLHDWTQRPHVQTAPTFDHWQFPPDSSIGVGAWAEYDLRLGDRVTHQRMVIADEQSGRYIRERSDLPQQPCDIHWLLEPIGDGNQTALTIAIHLPQSRNWFASLWQSWTTEPALQAAYAAIPARLTARLQPGR